MDKYRIHFIYYFPGSKLHKPTWFFLHNLNYILDSIEVSSYDVIEWGGIYVDTVDDFTPSSLMADCSLLVTDIFEDL